ncbi:ribosomal protection-like ABC-F family protein [Enterococcus gallinarum]|uniref:ribosomal protection-like ABC-F family protein n=1 Tax=Enterococcus gallinarum TaxID=1353 RepID=UPI0018AB219C|nr:ABC-F family ATP-binding cassette domain-containing protein [Enterococcus gallinarum]
MLIQANKISKNFGGTPLFEQLTFQIDPGEKIGLIGINGSGKTTLLDLLLGTEKNDTGTISRRKSLSIGHLAQEFSPSSETVLTYLQTSSPRLQEISRKMRRCEQQMSDPDADLSKLLDRYGQLQLQFEELDGYLLEDRILASLRGLGIAQLQETSLQALSGGERVKVELARLLLTEHDLLLLDEPTNHLDLASLHWLENYLINTKKAYIVISHDRAFLDKVTTRICEIEDGQLISYPGNYSQYRSLKQARIAELTKNYELKQKECQRLKAMIRRYRQWGNEGDNEDFFRKAKEIEKRLAKITLVKPPLPPKKRIRTVNQSDRTGREVFIARNIGKVMADRLLFEDSSFSIYRGDRLAIIGENGTGKTTLIQLLLGTLALDAGTIKSGSNLQIGYLPQKLSFSNPAMRVLSFAYQFIGNEQSARQQLAQIGFYQDDVSKRIQDLSGGEKIRLYLLKLFHKKINVLLLDEPTNHLDIYAREEIEELIQRFGGTLIAVSHDRYFLKQTFQDMLLIRDQQVMRQPIDWQAL